LNARLKARLNARFDVRRRVGMTEHDFHFVFDFAGDFVPLLNA